MWGVLLGTCRSDPDDPNIKWFLLKMYTLEILKNYNGHLGNLKIPENDVLCTHKKTPFDVVGTKKSHVFVLGLDFTGL